MKIITIDFETFYDSKEYSLSKVTTEAYLRDPRFEVIGVSVMNGSEGPVWFSGDRTSVRRWLKQFDWENSLALAHNNAFDSAILLWHFGIRPKGFLDTLSMANALHGINKSVSLKSLAEQYFLPAKGTEVLNADGKRRDDFTPEELAAYGEYCNKDVWLCRTLFDLTAPAFSRDELRLIDLTIRMFVEPVLRLDLPLLEQHLVETQVKQRDSLKTLSDLLETHDEEETKDVLMSNLKFAALLEQLGVTPPKKISPTTGRETFAFAKTDEGFTALLEHSDAIVQAAVAARLGNKTTIEESRTKAFIEIAKRGSFPFPLKYSGASVTHRWSGFDVNVQNMPRGGVLRQAIKAPKGFKIVAADLSNIELRLGLYMACQDDKLDLIRKGLDLYVDVATPVFGKTYEELAALGKKSRERTTGKVISLSCIYGTGAAKLKDTLRIQGKVRFSDEETQRMTDLYRDDYDMVVSAWNAGKEVLDCLYAGNQSMEFLRPGILQVTPDGIVKPSGLILTYPDLRWTKDKDSGKMGYTYEQKRKTRDRVYGSKCFQRVVQSLARDIIAEQMLKIDKRYWVAGTVHDEIVCVVAEDEVEEASAFMLEVMRAPPSYCPDLPLDAEVGVGDNYGDAK